MTFSIDCSDFRTIMLDYRRILFAGSPSDAFIALQTTEDGLLATSVAATGNVGQSALYDVRTEGQIDLALRALQLRRLSKPASDAPEGERIDFVRDVNGDVLIAELGESRTVIPIAEDHYAERWTEPEFRRPYYLTRLSLIRALGQTVFAIAHVKDTERDILANPRAYKRRGLCLEIKGDILRCAGMDAARMAWADIDIVHGSSTREDYTAVVHWEAAEQLLHMLRHRKDEYVALCFESGKLQFCAYCSDVSIRGSLLSDPFPDYRTRLKPDWSNKVIVVRKHLFDLAKHYVAEEGREAQIWFAFKDSHIFSRAHSVAPADEQLPIDVRGDVPKFGLRARLLVDALWVLSGHLVEFTVRTPAEPCFIRDPRYEAMQVIMPLEG